MRTISFIYILFIFLLACHKEDVSPIQSDYFIKFYGNYMDDVGYCVQETPDGGLIITGAYERLSTGKDILLMKVDEYGKQAEWSPKYFDGDGLDDEGYSLLALEDGYAIAGTVTSESGDKDAIVIRTDLEGNSVGDPYIFKASGDEYAMSLEKHDTDGFIVVGYSENSQLGNKSFFAVILDQDLSNPRITTSPSNGEEFLRVFFNKENEYLALGNRFSSVPSYDSQFFIAKLNDAGNIYDIIFLGSPDLQEVLVDAVAVDESVIYILGNARENGEDSSRIILKKLVDLEEQWTRFISSSGDLMAKALCLDDEGKLVIGADKLVNEDINTMVYFLDEEGDVTYSREYGDGGHQSVEDLIFSDRHLIILGRNIVQQNSMISLIKTDENGNLWE